MGRIVTPGALEKAVCGGQQLKSIDAQFREMRMAFFRYRQPDEVCAFCVLVHEGQNIFERAKRAFASAGLARPGPCRRQLVNHHSIVGRKAIGRRIVPEGGDFSGGIDDGQCPVCQPDDGGRLRVLESVEPCRDLRDTRQSTVVANGSVTRTVVPAGRLGCVLSTRYQ